MSAMDPRDHALHDLDALSEAVDGRLPADELETVLERVRSCPACGAAYEAMAWTRAEAGRVPAVSFPPGLEDQIRNRLDREVGRRARMLRVRRNVGLSLAAALLAALAAVLVRFGSGPPGLPRTLADHYRARTAGRLPLVVETSDPARLEAWLASASLGFPTRVFDLRMMAYELRGGGTHVVAGRASALLVYRETASGRDIICWMLRGGFSDLPAPDETREHDGIPFRIHEVDGINLVFWPEGDVLCALVGDGDREGLVQLAFAKAMKARPREG